MKILRISVLLCGVLTGITNHCSAGIIVSFAPSSPNPLTAGSTGTMDVLLQSDAGDVLDGFLVDIAITPTGGSPVGGLQFSATQNDSELADTSYVFYLKSLSQNTGAIIGATSLPFDVFSGSDFSDDGSGIPFAGIPSPETLTAVDRLLFRLDLTAFAAGTYEIDLLPSSQFADVALAPIAFSSTPGLITVNGTAAVPEPGSIGFLSLLAVVALRKYRRKRKQLISSRLTDADQL